MLSKFLPSFNAPLSTEVLSSLWTADAVGSISVDAGFIYKNSVKVVSPATFLVGDTLCVALVTSDIHYDTRFLKYSIGGDVGFFSVSTQVSDSDPETLVYLPLFSDTEIVPSAVVRSPEFELQTPEQYHVSVPSNAFGAVLFVNGVASGQSAVVTQSDRVSISINAPADYAKQIVLPWSVGGAVSSFSVTTKVADILADAIQFTNVLAASYSTLYQSNAIVVSGLDAVVAVAVTLDNGTLYKNGVAVGSATNVVNGDTLYIKVTSASRRRTPVYCTLTVGRSKSVWTVCTKTTADDRPVLSSFKGKLPFEITFTPDYTKSALYKVDPANNNAITTYLIDAVAATNLEDQTTHAFLADYFQSALLVVDSLTGALLKKIALPSGSKPASVVAFPLQSYAVEPALKFVSLSGRNEIVALDPSTGAIAATYPVDGTVYGLTVLKRAVYGACHSTGKLAKIAWSGASFGYVQSSIAIGGKPFALAVNKTRLFVSDVENNRVVMLRSDIILKSFNTGVNPWGLCASETTLYVCNSFDNTLSVIDIESGESKLYTTYSCPSNVVLVDNVVYVAHLCSRHVLKLDAASGNVLADILLPKAAQAIAVHETSLWFASLYQALPNRVDPSALVSTTAEDLVSPLAAEFSVTATVGRLSQIWAPSSVSKIAVGEQVIESGSFLEAGTTYTITTTAAEDFYSTLSSLAFTDFSVATTTLRTVPDLVPNFLAFTSTLNSYVGSVAESPTILVSGLTPGFTSSLLFDTGSIRLNDVLMPENAPVTIQNGDRISLVTEVAGPYGFVQTHKLKVAEEIVGSYKVYTISLNGGKGQLPFKIYCLNVDSEYRYTHGVYDAGSETVLSNYWIKSTSQKSRAAPANGLLSTRGYSIRVAEQSAQYIRQPVLRISKSPTSKFIRYQTLSDKISILFAQLREAVWNSTASEKLTSTVQVIRHALTNKTLADTASRVDHLNRVVQAGVKSIKLEKHGEYFVEKLFSDRTVLSFNIVSRAFLKQVVLPMYMFARVSANVKGVAQILYNPSAGKDAVHNPSRLAPLATIDVAHALHSYDPEASGRLPQHLKVFAQSGIARSIASSMHIDISAKHGRLYSGRTKFSQSFERMPAAKLRTAALYGHFEASCIQATPNTVCGTNGLFTSEQLAQEDGLVDNLEIQTTRYGTCWTWEVASDKTIVCSVPAGVAFPIAGYISGG